MTGDTGYMELPAGHRKVVDECIAEAWRNVEASDAQTPRDIAADIAQRLADIYGITTHPKVEPPPTDEDREAQAAYDDHWGL